MPSIIRKGIDPSAGHCYFPRPADQGSLNVFVNGTAVVRLSDHYPTHRCGGHKHDSIAVQGSPNVFVNGKPIHRQGDVLSCGDVANAGSLNVFANSPSGTSFMVDNTVEYSRYIGTDAEVEDNQGPKVSPTPIPGTNTTFKNSPFEFYSTEHDDEESIDHTKPPLTNDGSVTIPTPSEEDHTPPVVVAQPPFDCSNVGSAFEYEDPSTPGQILSVNSWQELCNVNNGGLACENDDLKEYYDNVFAPSIQLSTNFTLANVTTLPAVSTYRLASNIGLTQLQILANLCELANVILEPMKDKYGNFLVTSAFRKKSGGSQHNIGKAIDIQFPGFSAQQYWDLAHDVKDNIPYKMFILEYGGRNPWFHLDLRTGAKRVLTQVSANKYSPGLIRMK